MVDRLSHFCGNGVWSILHIISYSFIHCTRSSRASCGSYSPKSTASPLQRLMRSEGRSNTTSSSITRGEVGGGGGLKDSARRDGRGQAHARARVRTRVRAHARVRVKPRMA